MKAFDPNKPCQYRNGEPARIVCTDRKGARPIISLSYYPGGTEKIFYHYESGQQFCDYENSFDLINTPTKQERWVNVYRGRSGAEQCQDFYPTREEAFQNKASTCDYIATGKVEWEE